MTEETFKRKLTAILSADVQGYSRLMGEDEDATIRTLTTYRELMSTLIQKHRGRVVDSPGDNLLAEFLSVVDAVRCAVEIQEELRVRNAELPENRRMQFRIGINLGDVVEEGERIYGDGINIAARVEGLAEGGGICISGTVYDSIKNKLSLSYESLGEHTVKNITEPVRVYRMRVGPEVRAKKAGPRRWQRAALAIAVVLVLCIGAVLVWNFYFRRPSIEPVSSEKMAYPLPDKPSIAVLPFENLSGDPGQDHIVDGITDGIITGLSRTPEMFVIARNSTFTYKGKPVKIKQVSEELGVRYVLEGSVQKEGDRLRVNAQLIDAIKGHHLWAEKYDRDLKGLFALQDEITMKVITELQVKLTEGEHGRVLAKGTNKIEAYLKCLQAISMLRRETKEDSHKLRKMFEEAIALDPNYAIPYLYLGFDCFNAIFHGWSKSPEEDLTCAEEFARKAIELDDSLGLPHRLLADIYGIRKQWDKAIEEAERGVSIDPNTQTMFGLAGILLKAGRYEESIALFEKILRLDPYPPAYVLLESAFSYFLAERYEDALAQSKRVLECAKRGEYNLKFVHLMLAQTYTMLGQEEETRHHVKERLRLDPNTSLEFLERVYKHLYKNQADIDRFINAARKAGFPDKPPLPLPEKPSIAVLPLKNISDDPEQEYFADGMTEDLITDLSKISGLFVIARNSVFTYKGKSVKIEQVGRELGVRYVLEGSVRRANNKVRINAQLIDATTGGHLWAERYDGIVNDVFALQDKVTQKIVTALAVELTPSEQEQATRKETDNIAAYDAFLKGWGHYLRRTPEDFAKARSYFEKAIDLDPNYGRAYAALAKTYWSSTQNFAHEYSTFGGPHKTLKVSFTEAKRRANEYLQIAMKNPTSLTHTLSTEFNLYLRLYKEAIAEAERAIALNPNDSDSHGALAKALIFAGRPEEALDAIERAMRLDPHNIAYPLYLRGLARFCMGQLKEAVTSIERSLIHNPEFKRGSGVLAAAYAHMGRDQEASTALIDFKEGLPPQHGILKYTMWLWPFKDPEVAERFADGLLKAGSPGQLSQYLKIYAENQLSGTEIRKLLFGRTRIGIYEPDGGRYSVECTNEGKIAIFIGADKKKKYDEGTAWIEGDMLCEQFKIQYYGMKNCGTVFYLPEGTREKRNEYVLVSLEKILPFSMLD